MSLHAQLSPEALAKLHAQQRSSTITSIMISILTLLLLGIILLYLLLPQIDNFSPEIVSYRSGADNDEKVQKRELNRTVERKPSAPSSSMAKVIAAATASPTAIPVPEINVPDPSADFGNGSDFGEGWGEGTGEGGFGSVPMTMRKRCSLEDRLSRLEQNGGTPECEEAVVKALRWLKKTQNPDGSWSDRYRVGMTGMAVLAFLGHCDTPNSEEFGDAVTRGIVYLVNVNMRYGGKMGSNFKDLHWCYEHAIATYALAEAYTFCKSLGIKLPNLDTATKRAGDFILTHQNVSGAWAYHYNINKRGGDVSIILWNLQALKACKHTGLWEDYKVFTKRTDRALDFVRDMQHKSGGIGYNKPHPHPNIGFTLTGAGVLGHQMWGRNNTSVVRKGAAYIRKNTIFKYNTADAELYDHYYNAQAMMNRGGADWAGYNSIFRDELLKNQNEDGTWKDVGGGAKVKGVGAWYQGNNRLAVLYRTCLATFMLEVYYRFLPGTGGAM